jgi:hypothetical protein
MTRVFIAKRGEIGLIAGAASARARVDGAAATIAFRTRPIAVREGRAPARRVEQEMGM